MTNHKRIMVIEEAVCNYFELDRENIYKHIKQNQYVKARYLIWYYCKKIFDIGVSELGRHYFRHHTSIMHGIKQVYDSIETKQFVWIDVNRLDPTMEQIGIRMNMKVIIEVETGTNWRSMITDISEKYNIINYQVI